MIHTRLDYSFGRDRLKEVVYLAGFLWGSGLIFIYQAVTKDVSLFLVAALLTLLGLLAFSTIEGVKLDTKSRRYKHYLRILFIKIGLWKSFNPYGDILCLRSSVKYMRETECGEINGGGYFRYEIYLANKNHLKMILIKTADSRADAEHDAHDLGCKLGMEWVQYNPACRRPRRVLGGMMVSEK